MKGLTDADRGFEMRFAARYDDGIWTKVLYVDRPGYRALTCLGWIGWQVYGGRSIYQFEQTSIECKIDGISMWLEMNNRPGLMAVQLAAEQNQGRYSFLHDTPFRTPPAVPTVQFPRRRPLEAHLP
jgi:hypothetical protein